MDCSPQSFKRHIENNHKVGPLEKIECPECGEMFRPTSLPSHRARVHGKIPKSRVEIYKPTSCTVCAKQFKNYYDMSKHRSKIHNSSIRIAILYECSNCKRTFKQKHSLTNHQKKINCEPVHEPLECSNCIESEQNFIVEIVTDIHQELDAIESLKTRLKHFNK